MKVKQPPMYIRKMHLASKYLIKFLQFDNIGLEYAIWETYKLYTFSFFRDISGYNTVTIPILNI